MFYEKNLSIIRSQLLGGLMGHSISLEIQHKSYTVINFYRIFIKNLMLGVI